MNTAPLNATLLLHGIGGDVPDCPDQTRRTFQRATYLCKRTHVAFDLPTGPSDSEAGQHVTAVTAVRVLI